MSRRGGCGSPRVGHRTSCQGFAALAPLETGECIAIDGMLQLPSPEARRMASCQGTDVQDRPTAFWDMTSVTRDKRSVTTRVRCNAVARPSVLQTRGEGQGAGAARLACEVGRARRCTLWRRLGRAGVMAPCMRRVESWGHHLVGGVCGTRMSPCLLAHRGDATPHHAHPRHGQKAGRCADGAVACTPPLGDASEQR
jgi:hypothetical protein